MSIRIFDSQLISKTLNYFWNRIQHTFQSVVKFFEIRIEVSLWFLVILPLIVIGVIILFFWIISKFQNKIYSIDPLQTVVRNYREDVFGDVLYRWDFIKDYSNKYKLVNISHYCPQCICLLVYSGCPICGGYFGSMIKSNTEINALVWHNIEVKINTKEI